MANSSIFTDVITSEEEIRELVGYPSELVQNKVISSLDQHCRRFISLSPIIFVATSDQDGACDVSPRGDAPNFVRVIDDTHLVIPERPGNRRLDTILNILSNPRIGLIFIIPGFEETLRINGSARIIKDAELLQQMHVNGKIPQLGIGVEIEECFVHCAKAFKRSKLWSRNSWPSDMSVLSAAQMLADHAKRASLSVKEVSGILQEAYTKRMY